MPVRSRSIEWEVYVKGTGCRIALALLLAAAAGCATGRPISLSGRLASPGRAIAVDNVLPRVAVVDFDYAGPADGVIGRDYDNVRPILWKGSPGPAVADLVAASLTERGVPVVRVAMAGHVPGGVLVTVRGNVGPFRVDAKRIQSVKTESVALVGLTVFAEGDAVDPGWSSGPLTAEVWSSEPFFVTPDGVRDAVKSAAEAVADEAARSLMKLRGAFQPPDDRAGPQAGGSPATR
jgi:hypothetical protein